MKLNPALALAGAVTTIATTSAAQPNYCAVPTAYLVTVEGNTVTICPDGFEWMHCPGLGIVAREGADGTVVVVEKCVLAGATTALLGDADAGGSPCYVDECVPPGTYRYQYGRPFQCCPTSPWTDVVDITSSPSSCPSAADAGATPDSGNVPLSVLGRCWVPPTDAGTLDAGTLDAGSYDSGVYVAGNHGDSGCAVRPYSAPTGALLGFNGVVGALGLLLMARRRRTRS